MITALIIYLIAVNIVAVVITATDKFKAVHGRRRERTPESTLLTIAAFGGSVAMLLTMLLIRHKTQKPKFMVGIPIIILLQLTVLYILHTQGVTL